MTDEPFTRRRGYSRSFFLIMTVLCLTQGGMIAPGSYEELFQPMRIAMFAAYALSSCFFMGRLLKAERIFVLTETRAYLMRQMEDLPDSSLEDECL